MAEDEQVRRFTRSVLELVREAVAAAHDNIVAVSIVHVESNDSVQAYVMTNETLDQYAHHLAEKQRGWLVSQGYQAGCVCGGCSWCLAQEYIDLIDPEKRSEG